MIYDDSSLDSGVIEHLLPGVVELPLPGVVREPVEDKLAGKVLQMTSANLSSARLIVSLAAAWMPADRWNWTAAF